LSHCYSQKPSILSQTALYQSLSASGKKGAQPPGCAHAAEDWIQHHYEFQPATLDGKPVDAEVTIPVRFSLQLLLTSHENHNPQSRNSDGR